jgi:hypothetical protein
MVYYVYAFQPQSQKTTNNTAALGSIRPSIVLVLLQCTAGSTSLAHHLSSIEALWHTWRLQSKWNLLLRLLLLLLLLLWRLLLLLRWWLLLWCKVNMQLLLLRLWWLLLLWLWWLLLLRCKRNLLWMLVVNHLMMPVVVSVVEHFPCLKHNMHNGEILVVVVTICNQPMLKEIVSLEQNLNKCRVLLTGKRERVNLSSRRNVCKVSKCT